LEIGPRFCLPAEERKAAVVKPGPPVYQVATTAGADPTTAALLLTNEATERTYFWCPDGYK
jgi:hypothetical protein